MKTDQIDRKILNLIQAGFPIAPEPYRDIGEALGISEENVIARIKAMLDSGIIRRLGGIFDSDKLGYYSTLCAMKVEKTRIDKVAAVVNAYPGVTHNYLRDHELNMWFTATVQSQEDLEHMLNQIKRDTGIKDILSLPAEKIFKIRVNFVLD
jgi:DNA-binding Lrp family transcriptional regulator